MQARVFLFVFSVLPLLLSAQKEYNIWCFGNFAGLDFNHPLPQVILTPKMSTPWGSSSISDTAGNLLFYTHGATVWNREHKVMKNGTGLLGKPSAMQSSLIVRQAFTQIYYIFTCDVSNELPQINTGVHYSVVDMRLDSGRGEVIVKNRLLHPESAEKLAAVRHANNRDVWIATGQIFSDTLHTYLLSDTGLSAPILNRNPGATLAGGNPGPMKFSPDGKKLAYMDAGYLNNDFVYLLDFDDRTGVLSNPRKIEGILFGGSIEFSPDSRYLYIADWWNHYNSGGNYMLQTDVSRVLSDVHYRQVSDSFLYPWDRAGALQLGPDGKIYKNGGYRLLVIENPNERVADLRVYPNGPVITTRGHAFPDGFPAMVSSALLKDPYLISRGRCAGDTVVMKVVKTESDSVVWNWGDGQVNVFSGSEGSHVYSKGGEYYVTAVSWTSNRVDTARLLLDIKEVKKPVLPPDTILCAGEQMMLRAFDSSWLSWQWNDGTVADSMPAATEGTYILTVKDRFCAARDTFLLSFGEPVKLFIGNDTAFCDVFHHVISAGKPFMKYRWNTGDTTYSLAVNSKGQYALRVEDHLSCDATDTIEIDELIKPSLMQKFDSLNCLFTTFSTPRHAGVQYLWSTGDTGISISVTQKGFYTLTQRSEFCSRTDTFRAVILSTPDVSLGADTMLCFGKIILRAEEQGMYSWSTGETGPSLRVTEPGTYVLTVSRNGCSASDTVQVHPCGQLLFFIPDAFSPDGNGLNDEFRVWGENIAEVSMEIYNGWGEKLHEMNGPDAMWDGNYMGRPCPQGVYLYKIRVVGINGSSEYLSGMLHLLR